MLIVISGLKGADVEGSDGHIGTVRDFLFDAATWQIRWMEVDVGTWLHKRKVLIHPSTIAPLEVEERPGLALQMMRPTEDLVLSVRLTRQQIEASPTIREDEPITKQIESYTYDYYRWDPDWGRSYFSTHVVGVASPPSGVGGQTDVGDGGPHSVTAFLGSHMHATDGDIGHVANIIVDDIEWNIRYLVVATSDWWPGEHVLLAPYAVQQVDWPARRVGLSVTRDQVRSSPPWDPVAMIDQMSEQRLHAHYGWPGYGW